MSRSSMIVSTGPAHFDATKLSGPWIMGEYFRGWGRRLGLVTLLMACAFAFGWVRSLLGQDYIRRYSDPQTACLVVSERQLLTFRYTIDRSLPPRPWIEFPHVEWGTLALSSQSLFDLNFTWHFRWLEFGVGEATNFVNGRFHIWIVPYWSIVIPLTLLSAILLLAKPGPAKKLESTRPQ